MATATSPLPADNSGGWSSIDKRDHLWWIQIGAISVLTLALYATTLMDLANDWWTDPALSQGLVIPPFALYLAWLRAEMTLSVPVVPDNRGLFAIGGACFLFLLGKLGAEFFLARISFVLLLVGLIWTFWGVQRLRTLTFPLLLLETMIPLPAIVYNSVAGPLQLFASDIATRLAQALGVVVYRDGNIIYLADISLGVERACSGLNSLSALIVGSLLLGFLLCSRTITRVILVVLSIPLAIAMNVLRVTGTALLADYRPELAMGYYHLFSGWMVFLFGFAGLYGMTIAARFMLETRRTKI